jgi:hypothetical protein
MKQKYIQYLQSYLKERKNLHLFPIFFLKKIVNGKQQKHASKVKKIKTKPSMCGKIKPVHEEK